MVALTLAVFGGSFFPMSQAPEAMAPLSLLTPHAWFLRGINDLAAGGGHRGRRAVAGGAGGGRRRDRRPRACSRARQVVTPMNALAIAQVNVLRLLRDRTGLFFVFLLPVILIVVLGTIYGGRVAPRHGDRGGRTAAPLGAELVDAIRNGAVELELREPATVEALAGAASRTGRSRSA